jgi:hypothetical protein
MLWPVILPSGARLELAVQPWRPQKTKPEEAIAEALAIQEEIGNPLDVWEAEDARLLACMDLGQLSGTCADSSPLRRMWWIKRDQSCERACQCRSLAGQVAPSVLRTVSIDETNDLTLLQAPKAFEDVAERLARPDIGDHIAGGLRELLPRVGSGVDQRPP